MKLTNEYKKRRALFSQKRPALTENYKSGKTCYMTKQTKQSEFHNWLYFGIFHLYKTGLTKIVCTYKNIRIILKTGAV